MLAQIGDLSRGLHPVLLSRHGIGRSIEELAARCPIPVELDVTLAGGRRSRSRSASTTSSPRP